MQRRERGEPLEWVLGWALFGDLRLAIMPGVFVPRQRTVALAEAASALLGDAPDPRVLLDACTGCAPIACFVARSRPDALVLAGDVDPAAVDCASINGQRYRVAVFRSDLLLGFPERVRGQVSVVVANVPYVPDSALASLPADAREWEPRTALAGGPDGLQVLRELAAQAVGWLRPGGSLLSEISPRQSRRAAEDVGRLGYAAGLLEISADDSTVLLTATMS